MFKIAVLFGLVASALFGNVEALEQNNLRGKTIVPYNKTDNLNSTVVNSFTIKDCGEPTDLAQNLFLDIDPKLPEVDYTLYLGADLSQEVIGGTSQYDISLNFIPFQPSVNDLCTEIGNSNITCPLKAGHIASQSKGTVPTGVSGYIVIKNQWFDTNGARILCMQFTLSIS